jgi:hypothetical protein
MEHLIGIVVAEAVAAVVGALVLALVRRLFAVLSAS